MRIDIINRQAPATMEPLTCKRGFDEICIAGTTLPQALKNRVNAFAESIAQPNDIAIRVDAWLSERLLKSVLTDNIRVVSEKGEHLAWAVDQPDCTDVAIDDESIVIQYPWDVITVNEQIVSQLDQDDIKGKIYDGAHVEGHLVLGEGSVLLPGVFIEGNVIIGENCKVGPNCYIRGNSVIMDKCHVGQSVEIKNSILMNNVAAGHLTYLGDSIICPYTNFGAGTITANFRHDGKNHRSMADGVLLDTGRRKLGAIIGDHVHTGIHTSIYPGRKIWPDMMTLPGDVVQKDLKN